MECSASRNCGLRYGRGEIRSPFCSSNGGGEGAGLTGNCERCPRCLECGVTGDRCSRSCRRGVGLPRGAKGCDSMAKLQQIPCSHSGRSCVRTLDMLSRQTKLAVNSDAHSRFFCRRDMAASTSRELEHPAQSATPPVAPPSPPTAAFACHHENSLTETLN